MESPTNTGITQKTLNNVLGKYKAFQNIYPTQTKDLTQEQIENIYCQEYYKRMHGELINHPRVRDMVLDQNVMRDSKDFIKDLQKLLCKYGANTQIDGVLGSETLNTLNTINDPDKFVDFVKKNLPDYLKKSPQFTKGWKNRIDQY